MLNGNILAAICCLLRMLCNPRRTIREKPGAILRSVAVRHNVNSFIYNKQHNRELLSNQTAPGFNPRLGTACSDVTVVHV